jgi:hypothetical protein
MDFYILYVILLPQRSTKSKFIDINLALDYLENSILSKINLTLYHMEIFLKENQIKVKNTSKLQFFAI